MLAAIILIAIIGVLCLIMTGYAIWMMMKFMEKQSVLLQSQQIDLAAQREAAFRREKYLITLILTQKPELAHAMSLEDKQEEPDESVETLAGFGYGVLSKGR